MSNPPNVLSAYRTYSYHHILVVCDSTRTADILSKTTDIEAFHHPPVAPRFTPRPVDKNTGQYIVLINGMTDATLFIESAKWSVVVVPQGENASKSTTIQLDGEMTIIEPLGMQFMNILAQASNQLNSDPMGLVFMLKTVFVGITDNDQREMITTIRPLKFIPIDISAAFDETGSSYLMAFCGMENGVAKLAPISNLAGGRHIKIEKGQTLKSAFENFTKELNRAYYSHLIMNQKKIYDSGYQDKLIDKYRFVRYEISIDEGFHDYIAGTNENNRTENKSGDPIIPFTDRMGIEEAIDKIMLSSQQVVEGQPDVTYKIVSTISTTPSKSGERGEYVVKFDIQRYVNKVVSVGNLITDKNPPKPGEFIEFDYIFTGKNIDIKEFDIRMDLGLAFLQTLTTAQNIPDQQTSLYGQKQDVARGVGPAAKLSSTNTPKTGTPIFFGTDSAELVVNNYKKPVNTIGFQAMLNRHAAIENVQCRITIHGNPQLMDEMLEIPEYLSFGRPEMTLSYQKINPLWTQTPTLVKVNIKAPRDQNNIYAGFESFWYSDFYYLFAVDNKFEDGLFTQTLDMFAIPTVDETSEFTDEDMNKELIAESERMVLALDLASSVDSPEDALKALDERLRTGSTPSSVPIDKQTAEQRREILNAHKKNLSEGKITE